MLPGFVAHKTLQAALYQTLPEVSDPTTPKRSWPKKSACALAFRAPLGHVSRSIAPKTYEEVAYR